MSLLEDVQFVLRMVFDYFGVPPEMLIPVWDSQLCGQYRSIVRMIGTNLPLTPPPRIHIQIPLLIYRPHDHLDITMDARAVPSFADVAWVFEDEGESFAKTRNHIPPKKLRRVNRDVIRHPGQTLSRASKGGGGSLGQNAEPEAMKKITALERELMKLRTQIAMIVTEAPISGLTECQSTPGPPLMSPNLTPGRTSTPRCEAPPPPPPPPPPPLCLLTPPNKNSVLELIQQRRSKAKDPVKGQLRPKTSGSGQGSGTKSIPSMLEVLKDLNQVKLRTVERSPGGTPVRRRRSKGGTALLNDPAALIAQALKQKFLQCHHNTSSDKENSLELSPFGSPETPKISLHTRRSQGRLPR